MAPKLLYYAKKKINFKKLVVEDQPIDWKPNGIWYAPEGEWESFLDENFPGTDRPKHLRYKYIYEIKVRHTNMAKPDKSAVLKIRDEKEFDEFTVKYGCTNELGMLYIKWTVVAMDYGGIEIIPMIENRHHVLPDETVEEYKKRGLDTRKGSWYIYWDIPSGCVWSKDAIIEMNLVKKVETKK